VIHGIIAWCLRNRFLVVSAVLLFAGAGVWALRRTPVDAIPDIGELQVLVIADWPGRSPRDVEDQITYPLTTRLMGIPRVKTIRGNSAFGFSLVNIIFEEGVDFYWARTRVLERLDTAQGDMPPGVTPVLGPDATALGQIFWYTIENVYYCPDHPHVTSMSQGACPEDGRELVPAESDLGELRSLQDWYVRYQLNGVKGVSEVASVGGYVKQYQIDLDPVAMYSRGVSVLDVVRAVGRSNMDVGAKVFEEGGMEFIIRGVGFVKRPEDIELIVLAARGGVPVTVGDVADVTIGPDFRRNALDKEGAEAVGGVVIMRHGENPLEVIRNLKEKIAEIESGLPPGIRIVPFYDRTEVIDRATRTLKTALIEEIIVAALILMIFLWHVRSTLIITTVLPLGVLGAFLFMRLIDMPSDIMSLGGIAIAIGVMVDAGIVMTENIYRRLAEAGPRLSGKERLDTLTSAAGEVGPPIFFAILIILIAFVPVFALTGQSGKLFRPLAFTKTFVMVVSAILSITLLPVLSSLFLRGRMESAGRNRLAHLMKSIYRPAAAWAMRWRLLVVAFAAAAALSSVLLFVVIPSEFMPPLDEGDLLFMPVLLPGASLSQVKEVMRTQDIIITSMPEVETAVGKLGRAETATDPAPVAMIETVIKLKPKDRWRPGMTRDKLIEEIKERTRMPGVSPIMTQPIRNRIDMLATGIQTPVGIKVFGSDLKEIERVAVRIEGIVRGIRGARGSYAERLGNKPYLEIEIDRERAARYGAPVGDIQMVIATAVGGMNITNTVEGRERYPIRVRYPREMRDDEREIGNVLVPTPSGAHIPLSLVTTIRRVPGPAMIATENTLPYVRVFTSINTEEVGLMEFVDDLEAALEREIKPTLPRGVYYSIAGQYEYKREADRRLIALVPICLFIIYILLYIKLKSFSSALVLITALPFSFAGAVLLQHILGINFSVAVWVGYIALFGVAVEDGIIILDYMKNRIGEGSDIRGKAIEAAAIRVRPILMTTATTVLALLPVMFATGTGSEVMRPIATPTVGGMITCTLSNLFIVPILFVWVEERRRGSPAAARTRPRAR